MPRPSRTRTPVRAAMTAALLVTTATSASARADEPDAALAVALGAATVLVGFAVGGTLIGATAHPNAANDVASDTPKNVAGWFAIEGGFILAPLTSHAVVGEWGRGAVFAALPTATTLATIPVFAGAPDVVDHGTLEQQRWMWGFFCAGLAASAAGVVDAAMSPGRSVHVAPILGDRSAGIAVGGAL